MREQWKLAAVYGAVGAAAALACGATGSGEVRARRIVLEDERGREVAVMDTLQGMPRLYLMAGAKDAGSVNLGLFPNGSPYVKLSDRTGDHVLEMQADGKSPYVRGYKLFGKTYFTVPER